MILFRLKRWLVRRAAIKAGRRRLDEIASDPRPMITRGFSTEPKEGYVWNIWEDAYIESDASLIARIKASVTPPPPAPQ